MNKPIKSIFKKTVIWGILTILLLSLPGVPSFAQGQPNQTQQVPLLSPPQQQRTDEPSEVPSAPAIKQELTNTQEVASFINNFFTEEMEKQHVPGAVISIVKDGKILFTKGYGYANVEKQIPVIADRTLFRVASLSKLFTDTSVMQLYQQGLIDLDADINQYLQKFKIENKFSEPVTASNLMTQTDGTSQRLLEIAAPSASQMMPIAEFIPSHFPPIVRPPGKVYAYSNLGITLLGYLVEKLSESPFAEYIDKNIFQPLQMERSTFSQPLPPSLSSELATPYYYQSNQFKPYPFLYLNIAPAAALSATATDMAHFMIAHLQKGRYQNSRILQEEVAELMHQQHFTHHPKLPGTAYGFHERLENNLRSIGHAGNMVGYSSSLTLIPEKNLGIFTAVNTYQGGFAEKLLNQFLDRYYPVSQKSQISQPPANFAQQAKRFTGTYRDLEYPRDTIGKLTAPFGHVHVKLNKNNILTVKTPGLFFPKTPQRYLVPVEPLLFQAIEDDAYTAFAENDNNQITYMFNPIGPKIGAFEKIPGYETIVFQLWVGGLCILMFLSAPIVWSINYIRKRGQKSDRSTSRTAKLAKLIAGLISAMYLIFLIGAGFYLWWIGVWKLAYGIPTFVKALLYLPPIAASLTIALPIFTFLAWKKNYWSIIGRSYYSLVTLAALIFVPFLLYWKIL